MGAGGASGRWVMSERRDRRAELRRSAAGRPRRVSLGFFFQPPPPPLLPPLPFLFSCRCFPSHPTPALRSFPRGPARWGSFRAAVMDGAVRAGGSSASRARTKLRTAAAVRCSEPCPPRPPPPPPPPGSHVRGLAPREPPARLGAALLGTRPCRAPLTGFVRRCDPTAVGERQHSLAAQSPGRGRKRSGRPTPGRPGPSHGCCAAPRPSGSWQRCRGSRPSATPPPPPPPPCPDLGAAVGAAPAGDNKSKVTKAPPPRAELRPGPPRRQRGGGAVVQREDGNAALCVGGSAPGVGAGGGALCPTAM